MRRSTGPVLRATLEPPATEGSTDHGSIAATAHGARRSGAVTTGEGRAGGNRGGRLSPTRVREAMCRAARYARTGRLSEAQALYRSVLAARPDHRDALKAGALVAFRLDAMDEAAALLQRAVALDDGDAGAHNDLGNVLQASGRIDAALAAYGRAVELDPERAETLVNLGQALRIKGDLEAAAEALGRAAALRPDHAGTLLHIGLVRHAQGDLDGAEASVRQALSVEPRNAEACFALGNVLYAQGRLNAAVEAYGQAAALREDILDASFEVGKPRHVHAHLDRGDARAALRACDDLLARHPGQSGALAMKAVALWEAGEAGQARSLLDFDRLLRRERCAPPADFADMGALNVALADHVRGHPTLQAAPESYSMERGRSTGELLPGHGAAVAFRTLVEEAVDRYRKAMPEEPSHPFLADIPDRVRITAWGVILDEGAYQVPHIHPSAWLSGVYYVALPLALGADDDGTAGWIEFGRPYWDFRIRAEPETRLIEPEEGLMLLFPSYMFHRTLPFDGSGERISIAFDVLRGE